MQSKDVTINREILEVISKRIQELLSIPAHNKFTIILKTNDHGDELIVIKAFRDPVEILLVNAKDK